jgi:hypothetical protein
MTETSPSPQRRRCTLHRPVAILASVWLAACASSPQLDAAWTDAQLGAHSGLLHGATVLVACDASDLVVRQLCQEQVAGEVVARGATPVFAPPDVAVMTDRAVDPQLLPAARAAGAKAVLVVTVAAALADVSPGVSLSIGGFGFGRSSAVGVGVAAPIGGGQVTTGYSASARITETSDGRLVWTAKATAAPSSDLHHQVGGLARAVLDAAEQSGLF